MKLEDPIDRRAFRRGYFCRFWRSERGQETFRGLIPGIIWEALDRAKSHENV